MVDEEVSRSNNVLVVKMKSSILAENLSVVFPVFENSDRSLKNNILRVSSGGKLAATDSNKVESVEALDKLNFSISSGDRVALFGHNGSGKTTLLRTLAGIYAPVKGSLTVQGRIASLLDITLGLDPDATGYENIYLRGVLNGQNRQAIEERASVIAEFTELGDFLNLPVRTYSSGMSLRLAFSMSTSMDAEILLMDEWLSVGDSNFTKKAEDRIQALIGKSEILVIATHNEELIERVCNRKIHLKHGQIVSDERIQ
jgi:lipopolysaccharide transport system ATP-binding protein